MAIPLKEVSLLDIPDGTILQVQVLKKHAGHVALVIVAPNGNYKSITANDWSLNSQVMIDQNKKGENLKPLPVDWPVDHNIYKEPKHTQKELDKYKPQR